MVKPVVKKVMMGVPAVALSAALACTMAGCGGTEGGQGGSGDGTAATQAAYQSQSIDVEGFTVESLADGTRTCAPATARVSSLGEIAIFTDGEDMPMAEVFQKIYEKCEGKQTIDPKSPAEALKKYFAEVLPEYDRSRVHVSDMKKMATWYNLLVASGMTEFKTGNEESQEESGENGQQS